MDGARPWTVLHFGPGLITHLSRHRPRSSSAGRGRDAGCPGHPAQLPGCGFPAPGSCRKLGSSTFRALAAHSVSIRGAAPPVTYWSAAASGVCFGVTGSSWPGPLIPHPPPPVTAVLFEGFRCVGDDVNPRIDNAAPKVGTEFAGSRPHRRTRSSRHGRVANPCQGRKAPKLAETNTVAAR